MGNGRYISNTGESLHVAMLEDQSATASGPWIEVDGRFKTWSFAIDTGDTLEEGATDATVDIHACNQETKPAASVDGTTILTLTTAAKAGRFADASFRFCKAVKTAGTTPVALTVLGRFTP